MHNNPLSHIAILAKQSECDSECEPASLLLLLSASHSLIGLGAWEASLDIIWIMSFGLSWFRGTLLETLEIQMTFSRRLPLPLT